MHEEPTLSRYVVELRCAGDYPDVREIAARARAAAEVEGSGVRFVRAIYVPEDGACLLVFEAPTPQAARDVANAAGLEVSKISDALQVEQS